MSTLKVDTISEKTASGGITFSQDITATLSSSSNVKAPLNASGSAPVYACRAWVNFDGTAAMTIGSSYGPDAPPADYSTPNPIRASGNVSSITDNGTGNYTINFATAMPDVNYSVSGATGYSDGGSSGEFNGGVVNIRWDTTTPMQTGSLAIQTCNTGSLYDMKYVNVSVFR